MQFQPGDLLRLRHDYHEYNAVTVIPPYYFYLIYPGSLFLFIRTEVGDTTNIPTHIVLFRGKLLRVATTVLEKVETQ